MAGFRHEDFGDTHLPKATAHWPAILSGVTIFVLFTALVEALGRHWCRGSSVESGPRRRWRSRWTASIVAGVFLMFAVGYCTIGLARHAGWAVSSSKPLEGEWMAGSSYLLYPRLGLEWIGNRGFAGYQAEHKQLPPGGTFDEKGNTLHSWETLLLPYLYINHTIDMKLPWNHPANAKSFQSLVPEFINMDFRTQELFDDEGYGLSHYAANSRMLRANSAVKIEDVKRGTSNVILVGEVNHAFRPWGHPANWRDPATGINRPNGFGGAPSAGGARFVMMDGSVRFLNQDTDPQVLKALGSPTDDVP